MENDLGTLEVNLGGLYIQNIHMNLQDCKSSFTSSNGTYLTLFLMQILKLNEHTINFETQYCIFSTSNPQGFN